MTKAKELRWDNYVWNDIQVAKNLLRLGNSLLKLVSWKKIKIKNERFRHVNSDIGLFLEKKTKHLENSVWS